MNDKPLTLWITGKNECNLYVKPSTSGYDWIMKSVKTGTHCIKQIGGHEPIMSDRVKLHWQGFQDNQTR
jgi:hypothetical protein